MSLDNVTPIEDIRQRVFDEFLDCIRTCIRPRPGTFISIFARDSGGSNEMNVVGSLASPVVFDVVPNPGKVLVLQTLVITIIDKAIKFNKFGGISALANGVKFEFKEGGNAVGEIPQSPIKTNSQFYEAGLTSEIQTEETDLFTAMFNFFTQSGTTLELAAARGEFIRMTVQDDLTGLTRFKVIIHGYEVDE